MLTATANPESAVAICDLLGVRADPYLERGSLLRPNMSYSVMGVQSLMQKRPVLFGLVSEMSSSDAVVVYTSSKQRGDQLAEDLREGFPDHRVRSYHAEQPQHERHDTEVRWRAGEVNLMVATIAFGMGVDKASVRLVVHYDLPKECDRPVPGEWARRARWAPRAAHALLDGRGLDLRGADAPRPVRRHVRAPAVRLRLELEGAAVGAERPTPPLPACRVRGGPRRRCR